MKPSKLSLTIYYEHTDIGGVVYHSNYLNFAERARTEWLRENNFPNQAQHLKETGSGFKVSEINVKYIKPSTLDDVIDIITTIEDVKKTSFNCIQNIYINDEIITKIKSKIVYLDKNNKPSLLPNIFLKQN